MTFVQLFATLFTIFLGDCRVAKKAVFLFKAFDLLQS
jgi:hypothetical protein